jgi:hypothetical protein
LPFPENEWISALPVCSGALAFLVQLALTLVLPYHPIFPTPIQSFAMGRQHLLCAIVPAVVLLVQ